MVSYLDLKMIVEHIKSQIINKRIKKIYNKGNIFIFRIDGKILGILLPEYIVLTEAKINIPFELTNIAQFLRKRLINKKITDIGLINSDRIIKIILEDYVLYIELFSKGNLILCDKDNKILIAHHYEERKGRSIKKHRIYSPPVNIMPLDFSKTEEIFERLKNNVSKTDSIEKSLKMIGASTESITYHFPEVREIIETNQINEEDLNTVAKKVNQLWSCGFTSKYIKNLLEELKNDLMKHIVENIQFKSSETSEKKDALELEKIIRAQKQRITECKDDITKINKIIEYLTENYDVFESLLKDIKKDPGKKEIYEEKLNCKIDINYPKLKIKFL